MSAIVVEGLEKRFGATRAVDGVSFAVEKGEVFGFLGPNGAGKTTTIRCLMDFIRPTRGRLTVAGLDAQADSVEVKRKVGYLSPDVPLYPNWTGEEHIDFVGRLRGGRPSRARELLDRLEFDPTKRARTLSSGNKQKLGLILALMTEPEVLILDEPTSALDPLLQNTVYSLLHDAAAGGATVFFSSHNLPEVERICRRAAIIRQGKLVAVERIEALREKRLHTVTVRFKDAYDADSFAGPNTEIVEAGAHLLVFRTKGDLNPILKQLAAHDVADLELAHASLEELFLGYYHA